VNRKMTNVLLNESGTVVLNASGNGTVKLGPLSARSVWHPEIVHVSANVNAVNESQCRIYSGDLPIASNYRDGTVSGSAGDSSDRVNSSIVKCGQYIYAVWTAGDAGAVATLNVTGTKDI
jgi:hypothetical protein